MDASALQLYRGEEIGADFLPVRGVGWVLRWAAVVAVLGASAAILAGFAYQLAAERLLQRAAAAGMREAVLPRATSHSVEAAVRCQLASHRGLERATSIALERNGWHVSGVVRPQHGDRISVALSTPAVASLPDWLQRVFSWQQNAIITTRAEGPGQ